MSNMKEYNFENDSLKILYPSHEEAFALPSGDLFPIKNVLIGITRPFSHYKVHRRTGGKYYLFEYVLEGEGVFYANGKPQKIQAGDVYFIDKPDPHDFRSDEKKPLKKIWICFDSDYIGLMLERYKIKTGVYHANVKSNFLSLYNLAGIDTSPHNKFFAIAENLHAVVLKIAQCVLEETNETLVSIRNELLSSIYTKKTLDEIAAELFMSRSNLIRVFKKHTGITPYHFLIGEKLKIAKNLLSSTTMQIKNIAELLCFTDEHYFSFLFKQKTGLTPTEYRNTTV